MASGKHIPCGPCGFDDVIKDAGKWCTRCEEGLCDDCETAHRKSKSSRNHQVISIEDYRKIEHVSISQICEHHGENLEWFCKSHDEVLCVACVPSNHKACSDVIPISANSANARQSTALSDLEETINGTLRNVKQCIKNRESASNELKKQELEIKTMVHETRTNINGHLDKLQEKLLYELRSSSDTCKSKYIKILQKLKSTEEMLTQLREQTIHMKQFSSDLQVFLGTRQINKRVGSEVESIKTEFEATKDYELKVSFQSVITKLSNEVDEFGKIMVSESATNFDFREPKFDQAQMKINVQTSRSISDIKLQLIRSFQIKSKNEMSVIACIILPNRNLLIANTKDNYLIEYSDIGEHIRDIPVSSKPYGIAVIDPDRIVVTYGDSSYIEIMNNENFYVEKNFRLPKNCWGVSHADGKLYVVYGDSIQVLDVSGRQMKTIETASKRVSRINVTREKIICSDWKKKTVYCCQMNGKELWQFENKSMDFPKGLTIDNYQNVFVVGGLSENLTIIQHDGSASKTLLTSLDGLRFPTDVYYDKVTNALLICNKNGTVSLYKVL